MVSALKRLPHQTLEITVTITWTEVEATFKKIQEQKIAEIELPGFRKGKVPRDLAIKHLDKTKIYEEVLQELVPKIYQQVIKEQQINPIISPKIEVLEAAENQDWKLLVKTCEKPQVDLGNYSALLKQLKSNTKSKIWVPGEKKADQQTENSRLSDLLDIIYKETKVDLSELLIETEANRLLGNLVNELQKLGLSVEQYCQSQNKTNQSLREEYTEQAKKTLSLEFALEVISEAEKITIDSNEIENFINQAKTPAEKERLMKERYFIGSLLRRQKTLTHLLKPSVIAA